MASFLETSARIDSTYSTATIYEFEPEEDMKEGEELDQEKSFCPEITHFMSCVPEVNHPLPSEPTEE
jgi:hypothetical protein